MQEVSEISRASRRSPRSVRAGHRLSQLSASRSARVEGARLSDLCEWAPSSRTRIAAFLYREKDKVARRPSNRRRGHPRPARHPQRPHRDLRSGSHEPYPLPELRGNGTQRSDPTSDLGSVLLTLGGCRVSSDTVGATQVIGPLCAFFLAAWRVSLHRREPTADRRRCGAPLAPGIDVGRRTDLFRSRAERAGGVLQSAPTTTANSGVTGRVPPARLRPLRQQMRVCSADGRVTVARSRRRDLERSPCGPGSDAIRDLVRSGSRTARSARTLVAGAWPLRSPVRSDQLRV